MEKTDLRVKKTLRQIDQALLENLAQTEFSKITVDQLCQTAMINRSTFYKYYQDKFDLMEQFLNRTLDEFRRQVDVAFVNASPQNIHSMAYQKNFEQVLCFLLKKKKEYQLLWGLALEKPMFNEMIEVVSHNILEKLDTQGRTDEQIRYADLYARLFASDMMSLVRWWFRYEDTVTIQEVKSIMAGNMKEGMFKTFRQRME